MNAEVVPSNSSQLRQEAQSQLLGFPPQAVSPISSSPDRRPRRVTAEACMTDSLLSHAIEYLTDSREMPSGRVTELSPEDPDVQAILRLMEARLRVYLDCPVIERRSVRGLLGVFKGPERRRR